MYAELALELLGGHGSRVIDIHGDDAGEQSVKVLQGAAVFVREHADDQGLVGVGVGGGDRLSERAQAVGIMRAVEDYEGAVAELLKPCGVAQVAQSVTDMLGGNVKTMFLSEYLGHGEGTAQVVDLVRADQRQEHVRVAVDKARAVPALVRYGQAHVLGAVEGVVLLPRLLLDHAERLARLRSADGGGVGLDDARLLFGDRLDGVAEKGGVIKVDARDDRAQGVGDQVGRVQLAAHARLAHDDITALFLEDMERKRGEEFKVGDDGSVFVQLPYQRCEIADRL